MPSPEKAKSREVNAIDGPDRLLKDLWADVQLRSEAGVSNCVEYAKQSPERALMYAVGIGYLLRMLPITAIFGALISLGLRLAKPASLIYGVWKVGYRLTASNQPRSRTERGARA